MARQPYFVNTTDKKIDVSGSFGGGMVSQVHPEKLKDDQFVTIENGDLKAGGVVETRGGYGYTNIPNPVIVGNNQGRFKYNNLAGGQDLAAINGQLYTIVNNSYTKLTITGLVSFQNVRPIEAVQVGNLMYFATGSGLVKYDGVTASLVQAYAPNGLEALYIGTNGYAANPDAYLSDTTGAADVILGVVPDMRYGVANQNVTFTAFIQTTNTATLEYLFEWKRVTSPDYQIFLDWGTQKAARANFASKDDYMIRVSLRKQGTTNVLSQYVLPRYKVKTTPDETPEPTIDFEDMKLCNRIFYHYERLWLYGDTGNPDHLYCSHLNNFSYFPRSNIIRVMDNTRGALNAVEQYKNFLICWTDGSIQAILGDNPNNFQKQPIHMSLGTKFGYSTQIMKNYLVFVGNDNGIYILKSFNYSSDDKMNVERLDDKVKDEISTLLATATNVLSAIYNDQYYLYIETGGANNYIYRFYFESGVWVKDITTLKFSSMMNYNNHLLLAEKTGGNLIKLSDSFTYDGTNTSFTLRVVSKDFNFGMPHHRKKLKQYQILANLGLLSTIVVKLYTDNNWLSTNDLAYDPLQNSDAQKLKIMGSGRFRYVKFEINIVVKEKVQLIGWAFVFKENTPK